MIIIDVGAYNGNPYIAQAKRNEGVIVYAFEPNPIMFAKLIKLAPNNYHTFNMVVSEVDGTVDFYNNKNIETSSILPFNEDNLSDWPSGHLLKNLNVAEVSSIRLDTFISNENITEIDFLKIDAQGADLQVLKSCGTMLGIIEQIQVEVCDIQIYENGNQLDETVEYLTSRGFKKIKTLQHNKTKDVIFENEKD